MLWITLFLVVVAVIASAAKKGKAPSVRPGRARRGMARAAQKPNPRSARPVEVRGEEFQVTISYGGYPVSAFTPSTALKWLGKGDTLSVHGFRIRDPFTYTGKLTNSRPADPSQIDVGLHATLATEAARLPYWPCYAHLIPQQRFIYLSWLSSNRRSIPSEDGYLFIYYYGLERRILVDDKDKAEVFSEVYRLRRMHAEQSPKGPRGSFQGYSTGLLWFMAAKFGSSLGIEAIRKLVESTHVWTEDALASALAWFASQSRPLPAWMAYVVADQSNLTQHSVVLRRAPEQFRELFEKRYAAKCGEGLALSASKRNRTITYRPASAALTAVTVNVCNPLSLTRQFKAVIEIWNECVEELRRFSSAVRDDGGQGSELSAAAWEALPEELRKDSEHPLANDVFQFISRQSDENGQVFIRAGDLALTLGFDARDRITPAKARSLVETLEHTNFAIEPDARLTGKGYDSEELLAVFPLAYAGEPDSKRYGAAACILRLGVEIAEADGKIDDDELHRIMEQIEKSFELNDHERRRLEALRSLLLKTGSQISGLGKRLQEVMMPAARNEVGRLLVAVAGLDGVVTRKELTALRRCYRALGLAADDLEATISEIAPDSSDAPVVIQTGRERARGESIPTPPEVEEVRLDRGRIHQIMAESRQVSILLAQAMSAEADQVTVAETKSSVAVALAPTPVSTGFHKATVVPTHAPSDSAKGLPSRYASFFTELSTRERWNSAEAEELARKHQHMLSGALEALNDWAFDRIGNQLVYEEGDEVVFDKVSLSEVKKA